MKLRSYQHCAIEYIYARFFLFPEFQILNNKKTRERFNYFILADEGGLGKSAVSIKIIERIAQRQSGKIFVIICPAALKPNWIEEINKWLPASTARDYTILIETYSSILDLTIARYLYKLDIDLLILDEGHYLKSFDAQRTQIMYGRPGEGRKIIKKAKKVLKLTANPIANHVGEIYPFFWANKSHVVNNMTEDDFLNLFAESAERTKFGLKVTGVKNEDKLLKRQKFFLRRTIDQVDREIAQGTRIHIDIPIDDKLLNEESEMSGLLESLLRDSKLKDFDIEDMLDDPEYFLNSMSTLPGFVKYSEFRKRQGLVKIKPVLEYLKDIVLPEHKKFILFCVHRDVATKYYELLNAYLANTYKVQNIPENEKIKIILVHGGINPTLRHELLTEAKSSERVILISTIGAIKEGHNLQAFTYSYFCEIDWRYYVHMQCEFRTRRIGSIHAMFWYYFLFNKGMDKKVFKVFDGKKETLGKIYNPTLSDAGQVV